jgi:hypothetical protein
MKFRKSSFSRAAQNLTRLPRGVLAAAAVIFVTGIGVIALTASHAAGPFVSAEPENGTLSAPAIKITDSTASASSAVQFGGTAATALKGWQIDATKVGLAPLGLSCTSLPPYTGPSKPAHGTLISGKLISTDMDLSAGGITIERSCVRPSSVGRGTPVLNTTDNNVTFQPGADLVTIRDSEIDGSLLSNEAASLTAGFHGVGTIQRNYIHHFGSGLALISTGLKLDALYEQNYVTDMLGYGDPATTGNHSDAFTIRDFDTSQVPTRTAMIRNNRFDCDSPNATGAFFVQAWSGFIDNVTAEGNLLEGNGYQLILEANASGYGTHMNAINNRFSGTGFGPGYADRGPGWAQWSENYLNDPTKPDNKGAVVSKIVP